MIGERGLSDASYLALQQALTPQQALASFFGASLAGASPQQAFASSQHLAASRQHSCGAAQQGLSLPQQSLFLAQQPVFAVAAQQDFSFVQQAILALQQSPAFSSAGTSAARKPTVNKTPAINFNNMIHLG